MILVYIMKKKLISLTEGNSKEKEVTVNDTLLLYGVVEAVDTSLFLGGVYQTVNASKPYLYAQQLLDSDNINTEWIEHEATVPLLSQSFLFDYEDLLKIASSYIFLFTDKAIVGNLFKCNHETGHKEPIGASCHYKIPIVQGFNPTDPDKRFCVTVYIPVLHQQSFYIKMIARYPDNEIEYCRVELYNKEVLIEKIVPGLLDKRYLGQEMHFKDI